MHIGNMNVFLSRFGLLFHWIGVVVGLLAGGTGVYGLDLHIERVRNGELALASLGGLLLLIPIYFLVPMLAGWLIRWLLVGKIHFLPFK